MKRWLFTLLAACGGSNGGECTHDSDCGADVCARDGQCWAAQDVRAVRVEWTISHQTASATTCTPSPDLEVDFNVDPSSGVSGGIGFTPVPCAAGLFNVDKMPAIYASVDVLVDPNGNAGGVSAPIDGSGDAILDLPF